VGWSINSGNLAAIAEACVSTADPKFRGPLQSAGLVEYLEHACAHCPCGLSRYLLSKAAELLILVGHHLELPAQNGDCSLGRRR